MRVKFALDCLNIERFSIWTCFCTSFSTAAEVDCTLLRSSKAIDHQHCAEASFNGAEDWMPTINLLLRRKMWSDCRSDRKGLEAQSLAHLRASVRCYKPSQWTRRRRRQREALSPESAVGIWKAADKHIQHRLAHLCVFARADVSRTEAGDSCSWQLITGQVTRR